MNPADTATWWNEGTLIFAMLPSRGTGRPIKTLVGMAIADATGFLAEDHPANVLSREQAEHHAEIMATAGRLFAESGELVR